MRSIKTNTKTRKSIWDPPKINSTWLMLMRIFKRTQIRKLQTTYIKSIKNMLEVIISKGLISLKTY